MEEPLDELVGHEGEHQKSDEDKTGGCEMFEKEIQLNITSLKPGHKAENHIL